MARAGSLIVEIGADVAKLRENMEQTKTIFDKNMGDMRSIAKGAAGAIAGYFTVDMIKDSIKSTLDLADSMSKASQKVGFTVDTLYALNAAAQLSDVEFTNLESALGKFNKNLGEISMGAGDEAANALKNMGISTKDAAGQLKASDALLMEVSDKFQSMPDGISKTTLAMKLFGKSGAELIPLLNGGSESLQEFTGNLTEDAAKAAERLNDSFTRLGINVKSSFIKILGESAGSVNDTAKAVEDFGVKAGTAMGGAAKFALEHADNMALAVSAYVGFAKIIPTAIALQKAFNAAASKNPYLIAGTIFASVIFGISEALENYAEANKKATDEAQKFAYNFDAEKANKIKNQITEINATIFNQEKALKGLGGQAKQALQSQIDRLKAERSALEKDLQPKVKKEDKKQDKDLEDYIGNAKKAQQEAEALAKATEKAFGELNKNYLDGMMGQLYDLKLKYADELTALKGNEEAKAALKLSYIEKVEGLKLDYTIKQAEEEQQIAENYKQSRLRMLSADERYYKAAGDISSQWAVKEQQLQIELSNESIERRAAIIAFEKESFDESIAMDTSRLKSMKTAAEGAEFWSKKSIASLQNEAEKMNSLLDGIAGSMENTFMSIPDAVQKGTLETGKLLQSFADDVVKELWRIYVVKQLVAGATSAISNMFAPNAPAMDSSGQIGGTDTSSLLSAGYAVKAKGGAYDGGVEFYANGGAFTNQIVSKPTMFKYGGGLGVMGEAGPEAIMPLTRASDGSLGVRSTGGGTTNIVVEVINQTTQEVQITKTTQRQDNGAMIVSLWMQEVSRKADTRAAIAGMLR